MLHTHGVVTLVRFNGRAEPVPDEQIEGIRRIIDSGLAYDPYPYLREGQWVAVVRGHLKGLRGYIIRKDDRFRLVISVCILQRSVAVEVSPLDVEPLW